MSFTQALSTYLNLNLLIVIGFIGLSGLALLLKVTKLRMSSAAELRVHTSLLVLILGLTTLHPFLPGTEIFSPAAKVWAAPSLKNFSQDYNESEKAGFLSLPTPLGTSTIQTNQAALTGMLLGFLLLFFGSLFIAKDLLLLIRIKRNSFLVRRLGRVRILINDQALVPFSYWVPGQANVVVPSRLLTRRQDYQMAIAHELQHHRNSDTRWVYVLWGLKLVCILNPAIHFWNRWISEIQEFACDETLVDRNKVESQAYARCLVEVAQTAVDQKHVPVCATGLTFLGDRNLLKRRIEKMFSESDTKTGRVMGLSMGLLLAVVMGVTASASKGLVLDRRVTMTQAKEMAARAQSESGFPVIVNELVLKQLNRFIGTPEGRQFMRDSLARMKFHKAVVAEHLQKYGVPLEIMAVPIIESGYRNLSERPKTSVKAAGIWQFIPSTARNYGLRVNSEKDERMDIALNTDAAMRYLLSNQLRFKDWHLSALAYNMGESAVQKGMDAVGSRDAWTLIRNGYEGDEDYLAKVMAAILIMRNPDSVQ